MSDRTTQIRLTPEAARQLRELAAAFDMYQRRGVTAGIEGNAAELLELLGEAFQRNPVAAVQAIGQLVLFVQQEREAGRAIPTGLPARRLLNYRLSQTEDPHTPME